MMIQQGKRVSVAGWESYINIKFINCPKESHYVWRSKAQPCQEKSLNLVCRHRRSRDHAQAWVADPNLDCPLSLNGSYMLAQSSGRAS